MKTWIRWEHGLTAKPEIIRIATAIGCSTWEAAGRCMCVWEWAEQQTLDGWIEGIEVDHLDIFGGPGIGQAMEKVGWAIADGHGVSIPNFMRFNGKSSKKRAVDRSRQSRKRGQ